VTGALRESTDVLGNLSLPRERLFVGLPHAQARV
jgi:hypothetical protein